MKLNNLVAYCKATVYGFPAFKGLENVTCMDGKDVIISTTSPAVMLEQGIHDYFAPVIPRGSVFKTTKDVLDADLDADIIIAEDGYNFSIYDDVVIVSRHLATVEILKTNYPRHTVFTGNVTAGDVKGKYVLGVLPNDLIQHCRSFKAVIIKDFDYAKDGDLQGLELLNRMIFARPVHITVL